uniref:Uncharacterized protein n=1 Tax=Romanomermis culicivorax TaxID=13658 RepID=A0A915I3F5_ROMCU
MKKQNETQQRQESFEENDLHPVRRLEFDYLQDVDFAGKLRNVEQAIAHKTVLSKDEELKDLDDFDTVFAPKNQISYFGGTTENNRGDFVEQRRKAVLPRPEFRRASQVPIFDPISAWRQIDQSQQNNQVLRSKFGSDVIDDYPYDEYCRPVEEKIVVHLAVKPPLKRLDSKKKAASLDDLKNETIAQKTWESTGENYVNGYGVGQQLEYYGNSLEENDDDRNYLMEMAENHYAKEEFANGDCGVETDGNSFANGDDGYAENVQKTQNISLASITFRITSARAGSEDVDRVEIDKLTLADMCKTKCAGSESLYYFHSRPAPTV